MARNSEIVTLSIKKEHGDFLEEHKISPSAILQQKIDELMERHSIVGKISEELQSWKKLCAKNLQLFADFLQGEGIDYSKFAEWREKQDGTDKLV